MDKNKGKVKLNDELLDKVAGGIVNILSDDYLAEVSENDPSTEFYVDGTCPYCGGPAYRIVEREYGGSFEAELTRRVCPVDGLLSV